MEAGRFAVYPRRDRRPGPRDPHRRSRGRARRHGTLPGGHRQRPRRASPRGLRRARALVLRRPARPQGMAARQAQVKIRRIVVGLDFAPHSQPALAAAAMLAGDLDAELDALFVESEELHRLAGMPFARETGHATAAARPIDPAALERSLRAHADEARRALTALAGPRALRWTLRVTRGSVTEEVLAASLDADLAIMGVPGWSAQALRLATGAPSTLLVLPPSGRVRGPLVAICPVEVGAGPGRLPPVLARQRGRRRAHDPGRGRKARRGEALVRGSHHPAAGKAPPRRSSRSSRTGCPRRWRRR